MSRKTARSALSRRVRNSLVLGGIISFLVLILFPLQVAEAQEDPVELCNGVDDDGDGEVDEDFSLGVECQVPSGACLTGGFTVCSSDGMGVECEAVGDVLDEEPEGPAGSDSCFDQIDNDCDGMVDHQDPECQSDELCNGFDDDNDDAIDEDFSGLGGPCTVGTGFCERSGFFVCTSDGLGTTCGAMPRAPVAEGVPGSRSCRDGVDNDCDGLVDLADPTCQRDELCNGIDDDGDGDVDEDFAVGAECMVGVGACAAAGNSTCLPDGSDVFCNASALSPTAEGPTGVACTDGIDNDCDGLTDFADPDCGSALLAATCALPVIRGDGGASCVAWHEIQFAALNAPIDASITAELLALDPSGAVLASIPVQNGDTAQLINGAQQVKTSSRNGRHLMQAPIPMLRVRVDDGARTVEAYCSSLPFVDVVAPDGLLGNVSIQGEKTEVVVAIPRIDPAHLGVEIDGVDILAAMGVEPATDFPGGPYTGVVPIGGGNVEISDLIVESAGLAMHSSNTLRMQVAGLGGGRHVVEVSGQAAAAALPAPGSAHCLEDDLVASVDIDSFEILIDAPLEGEVVATVPTRVLGEVRHGQPIAGLSVNGLSLPVDEQTFEPGPGSGGTFILPIDAAIGQTDLLGDILGENLALGTFDAGPNRLVVQASDGVGNRVFAGHIFAVGDLLPTPTLAALSRAQSALASEQFGGVIALHEGSQVQDAMAVLLQRDGVANIIEAYCTESQGSFEDLLAPALTRFLECEQAEDPDALGCPEGSGDALLDKAPVDGACDPPLTYELRSAAFRAGDPIVCTSEFSEGSLSINVTLPDIIFQLGVTGGCSTTAWHSVKVDVIEEVTIRDPSGSLTLEEADFLSEDLMPEATFDLSEDAIEIVPIADNSSGGGFLPDLLSFLYDAANIATLGLLKLGVFLGSELFDAIASLWDSDSAPQTFSFKFPIDFSDFGLNGDFIVSQMLGFEAALSSVKISVGGLTAILEASFMPMNLDPDIPEIPGIAETPADPPMTSPNTATGLGEFAIADDTVNAILAALTAQGTFKSVCSDGIPISDFLPDECCDLKGDDCCNGVMDACNGLEVPACEALKAPSCDALADPFQQLVCTTLANVNIMGQTRVILCGRQELPPRLLIRDDFDGEGNPIDTPDQIETHLRLNDTRVFAILDRDLSGTPGDIEVLPDCFDAGNLVTLDCRVLETCLDLNVANTLSLDLASLTPALRIAVGEVQELPRDPGVLCEGELPLLFIPNVVERALSSEALMDITLSIELNTPLLQPEGFDLLGFGRLASPRLTAFRTSEATEGFDDYLGLVGDVEVIP